MRQRCGAITGAEPTGHRGGGAVGEEDAQADDRLHDGAGDAEPGQLGGAEVADDGGIGEQEERLGDERQEGGHGQPEDLGVVGGRPDTGACRHPSSLGGEPTGGGTPGVRGCLDGVGLVTGCLCMTGGNL